MKTHHLKFIALGVFAVLAASLNVGLKPAQADPPPPLTCKCPSGDAPVDLTGVCVIAGTQKSPDWTNPAHGNQALSWATFCAIRSKSKTLNIPAGTFAVSTCQSRGISQGRLQAMAATDKGVSLAQPYPTSWPYEGEPYPIKWKYGDEVHPGDIHIIGAGMRKTIVDDIVPETCREPIPDPADPTHTKFIPNVDRVGGVFFNFSGGGNNEIKGLTLRTVPPSGTPGGKYHYSYLEAAYANGGVVMPDGSVRAGKLTVTDVSFQGWVRDVNEGADMRGTDDPARGSVNYANRGTNAFDLIIDRSELIDSDSSAINTSIADGQYRQHLDAKAEYKKDSAGNDVVINGEKVLLNEELGPLRPTHQSVTILNSLFRNNGATCETGDHGMYLKAPFNFITIKGNKFENQRGFAIHRYGGAFYEGDVYEPGALHGVVTIENNTFTQPAFEEDPTKQEVCTGFYGRNLTQPRDQVYGRGGVLLDGGGGDLSYIKDGKIGAVYGKNRLYETHIINNDFRGNGIGTGAPITASGNIFRGYPRLPHATGPIGGFAVKFGGDAGPSTFSNNQVGTDIFLSVPDSEPDDDAATAARKLAVPYGPVTISGNTCVKKPAPNQAECDTSAELLPKIIMGRSGGDIVQANAFQAGTKIEIRGHDAKVIGNTMSAVMDDTAPLVTIRGNRDTVTDNTFTIAGRYGAKVEADAHDAVVARNVIRLLPGNSTPVTSHWRNDDGDQAKATYATKNENEALAGVAKGDKLRLRLGVANSSGTSEFMRSAPLDLKLGENKLGSAVIDVAAGFAYFGTLTNPPQVVKVKLSDFKEVGTLPLPQEEAGLSSAVIDTTRGYAYFGTNSTPPRVHKISLNGEGVPTYVGATEPILGQSNDARGMGAGVIDVKNHFAYFAGGTQLIKIDVGAGAELPKATDKIANGPDYGLNSGFIDTVHGFAYFTAADGPAHLVKYDLKGSDAPRRVGSATLTNKVTPQSISPPVSYASVVDVNNGYAYVSTMDTPARIVKFDVSGDGVPRYLQEITLNQGEDRINAAAIDPAAGYGYFMTWGGGPSPIVKVALGAGPAAPTRVGAISPPYGTSYAETVDKNVSVFDPTTGYVYFGGNGSPARILRVSVAPKWQFRLEYTPRKTTCTAATGWTQVAPLLSTTSDAFRMSATANLTDGTLTTDSAGLTNNGIFTPGQVKDKFSQTTDVAVGEKQYTEIEYSIQATSNFVPGSEYCFRLSDAGDTENFTYVSGFPRIGTGIDIVPPLATETPAPPMTPAPAKPVFNGDEFCKCVVDAEGRMNVRTACPTVDWTNSKQVHSAMNSVNLCIEAHPITKLYLPALPEKKHYMISACGNRFRTVDGGGNLDVSGDGIDKTILENVAGENCPTAPIGDMLVFGAGTKGSVSDMTFLANVPAQVANGAGAIYHRAEYVDPKTSVHTVGEFRLNRVKMDGLGSGVVAQTGDGGHPTAVKVYVTDSWFSNFRHPVISMQGDYTSPNNPRTVFQITGSHFEHIGAVCGRGYPFYLHFPFRDIRIENSEFVNLHHLAVSIFGGEAQPNCRDCTVAIRGNKFLQPLAAENPDGITQCACTPGVDTDCPANPKATVKNRDLYGHTSVILDGTPIPYTALIENNVFQSGKAIVTQNPVTVRNNVFLGSKYQNWTAAVVGDENNAAANSGFENNQFETSLYVPAKSPGFVMSGNTCVLDAQTKQCAKNGVMPMTLHLDSAKGVVTGNTFPSGAKIEVSGDAAKITDNIFSSLPADASALVTTVVGKLGTLTGNTFNLTTAAGPAFSIPAANGWTTSPNTIKRPALGSDSCVCPADKNVRVDVMAGCPKMDWSNALESNRALAKLTECALLSNARVLYFPKGTYLTSACAAGSVVTTQTSIADFSVIGDGIGKTVIKDVGAASCTSASKGVFLKLKPGTSGILRGFTLDGSRSQDDGVVHAGSRSDATGKLRVQDVAFAGFGRAVVTAAPKSALIGDIFHSKVMIGSEDGAASGSVINLSQIDAEVIVSADSADVEISDNTCLLNPVTFACASGAKRSQQTIGGPRAKLFDNTFTPGMTVAISGADASIHDNTFESAAGLTGLTLSGPRAVLQKNIFKGIGTGLLATAGATLGRASQNIFDGSGVELQANRAWSIYRNTFSNAGVRIVGGPSPLDMLVSLFRNAFSKLAGSAVTATSGADGLQVSDNTFEGDDKGQGAIHVDATAHPNRCLIVRNCFKTPKSTTLEVSGCTVQDNVCP